VLGKASVPCIVSKPAPVVSEETKRVAFRTEDLVNRATDSWRNINPNPLREGLNQFPEASLSAPLRVEQPLPRRMEGWGLLPRAVRQP